MNIKTIQFLEEKKAKLSDEEEEIEKETSTSIFTLPLEIFDKIAEFLDFEDLKNASVVSRVFADNFNRGFALKSRLKLSHLPNDPIIFRKCFRTFHSVIVPWSIYKQLERPLQTVVNKIATSVSYLTVTRVDRKDVIDYNDFKELIKRLKELKGLKLTFKYKIGPTTRIPEYHEHYLKQMDRVKCETLVVHSLAYFCLMGYMVKEVNTLIIRTEHSIWNDTIESVYVFLQFNAPTLKTLVIIGEAMQVLTKISFPDNLVLKQLVIEDPTWEQGLELLNDNLKTQNRLQYLKFNTPEATMKDSTLKIISQIASLDTFVVEVKEVNVALSALPAFDHILSVSFTRIQENVIPLLPKFPNAKKIEFRITDTTIIEDEDAIHIQPASIPAFNLNYLTHLEFRDIKRHTDLFTVLNAPNLTHFYVERMSSRQATSLSKNCPNIREVGVGTFTHFKELYSIYFQFKKLKKFKCYNLIVYASKSRKQESLILKKLLPVITNVRNNGVEFAEYFLSTNLEFAIISQIVRETLRPQSFQFEDLPDSNEIRISLKGRFCEVRLHRPHVIQKIVEHTAPYMSNFSSQVELVENKLF